MKTIIFDLGNVLLSFHPNEYLLQYFDQQTLEDLLIMIFCSDEWLELDLGNLTVEELIEIFSKRNPHYKEEITFTLNNWYKMFKPIKENIDMVDIIYEVVDARIPISSKVKDIDDLIKNKPKIMIMTKTDLCDINKTNECVSYYKKNGYEVIENRINLHKSLIESDNIVMWCVENLRI